MINRRNFFSKFSLLAFFAPFIPKLKSFLYDKNLEYKFDDVDTRFAVSSNELAESLKRVGLSAENANCNLSEMIRIIS